MKAVLKHELSGYFHSLTAYVFGAFLLVFVGIGSMLYNIQQAVANFEYVLGFISLIFVGLVPILTMRVLAEERKQRTDQLLYSLPITTTDIILGKYLALLVVFLIPLVMVAFYPLIFAKFGDVYLLTSYGSLIAFFIMGAALIAIGMFISSLTDNLGMAAVKLFLRYTANISFFIKQNTSGTGCPLIQSHYIFFHIRSPIFFVAITGTFVPAISCTIICPVSTGASTTTCFNSRTHSNTFALGISVFVRTGSMRPSLIFTVLVTVRSGLTSSFLA